MSFSPIEGLGSGSGITVGSPPGFGEWLLLDVDLASSPGVRLGTEAPGTGRRILTGHFAFSAMDRPSPLQTFIETRVGTRIILKNEPNGKWPEVTLEIAQDATDSSPKCTKLTAVAPDDSVESWVLLSRFMFLLSVSETFSITDDGGTFLRLIPPKTDPKVFTEVCDLSSIVRKLRYIEQAFNERFSIPDQFSAQDVLATEKVFRAIAQGEFTLRSDVITLRRLAPAELNLNEPPFTRPGVFSRRVEGSLEATSLELLGKSLHLGAYAISVKQAEIANRRVLDNIENKKDEPIDIRFVVYDHQIYYSFDSYVGRRNRQVSENQLSLFKRALEAEEPKELILLIDESLQGDVSPFEAIQIASGWLQYHDFPDRYCAQEPVLDQKSGKWQVPIHLAYADGRGGAVGELIIDLKTGVIDRHTPVEVVRAGGRALAEKLLHAR